MAPVWEDASRRLEGVVRFGRLNAEVERWITGQMRIRFVPQVLSTVAGSNSFKTLNGAITADTLISFASESFPNNIRTFNWESEFDSLVLNAKDTVWNFTSPCLPFG
jgi:thioredoxin-like negative regulator of GroEL